VVLVLLAAPLLLIGCGQKAGSGPGTVDKQAFDQAPPQVKQVWEQALEADRTNGYVLSQTLLYGLSQQPLSPQQMAAVSNQTSIVGRRMWDSANHGNAEALDAIRELRRDPPNRRR
jgi:hypothetical protein